MILLDKRFTSGVGGFSATPLTYTEIARERNVAVYERSLNGIVKDWETIIISVTLKGSELFGKICEEDFEHYPSTGQFSKLGFSFHGKFGKEAALKKMQELLNKNEEKTNPAPEKEMVIPTEPFTTNILAEVNNTNYLKANLFIKNNLGKTIEFLYEKNLHERGKPSKFYATIKTK